MKKIKIKMPVKPPLGLRPKWLSDEQRLEEILAASERYIEANKELPQEWMIELIELVRKTRDHDFKTTFVNSHPENRLDF